MTAEPVEAERSEIEWRPLSPNDAAAVHALHMAAVAKAGRPDLIRPETREFFERILAGGGRILGLDDDRGLLAYGVLQWDLPPEEDLRPLFGLAPDAPFAKLAGAAVRPDHWGHGLQESVIAARLDLAGSLGLSHLYATSAPGNWRSWANLLNQGLVIRALIEQYGGALRYIFYRDLERPDAEGKGDAIWVDVGDTDRQRRLIAAGAFGCAWRRSGERSFDILYSQGQGRSGD